MSLNSFSHNLAPQQTLLMIYMQLQLLYFTSVLEGYTTRLTRLDKNLVQKEGLQMNCSGKFLYPSEIRLTLFSASSLVPSMLSFFLYSWGWTPS